MQLPKPNHLNYAQKDILCDFNFVASWSVCMPVQNFTAGLFTERNQAHPAHIPSFMFNLTKRIHIRSILCKVSKKMSEFELFFFCIPQGRSGVPGVPGTPGQSVRGPKGEPGSCACSMTGGQKGDQGRDGLPGKHFLLS